MTERPATALRRDAATLAIGPSALSWDGTALTIDFDELSVPIPRRVSGRVRVLPSAVPARSFRLDAAGRHHWWPVAPMARVEVALNRPDCAWSGHGYIDSNHGDEPLEQGFAYWDWSRANLPDGAALLYNPTARDGSSHSIAVRFDAAGGSHDFAPPPPAPLPATRWRVRRTTRAEPGGPVRVLKTLEDTPFYSRSVLTTRLLGEQCVAMHESLSLDRFASTAVRLMLPWRMPRRFF